MATYTKITDFAAKDALLTGNPSKLVRGTEIGAEFDAIQTADADNMKKSAMGTGVETFLGAPSSANLAAAVTGETGTGALVFGTSPALTTPDIDGGTIDNAVIGGTTPAAGTFTTVNATTVNATTVDSTNIEVTNIKAKDGTASASIADSTGVMTIASSVLTTADINGGTIDGAVIGGATPAAITGTTIVASTSLATSGTLQVNGSSTIGDSSSADTHAIKGATSLAANSASAALTVTQTGSGNAFVVEDSASPDSTPFVIDASGNVVQGYTATQAIGSLAQGLQQNYTTTAGVALARWSANNLSSQLTLAKSRSGTIGTNAIVLADDILGAIEFAGDDGTDLATPAALIQCRVDGTPGTNDMPGRLVFSTTADGASSPTERMRIDSAGNVGIGGAASAGRALTVSKTLTGATNTYAFLHESATAADVTGTATSFGTSVSTADSATGPAGITHYSTFQGTISGGSRPAVTNQYGFNASSTLTGATNNYGFYSNIASGTGRWNFYAAGTAANYFGGLVDISGSSAGQIKFPATQNASADANTLDDYEEGTWTPTITFGGGSTGLTYTSQVGRYTKIGRTVTFECYTQLSNKGSSTGVAIVNGLPFALSGNSFPAANLRMGSTASSLGGEYLSAWPQYAGTTIRLDKLIAGISTQLTDADFANSTNIVIGGTYTV